jgi:hypothetical protein
MQSCKEYLYIFAAENAFYLLPQYHFEGSRQSLGLLNGDKWCNRWKLEWYT